MRDCSYRVKDDWVISSEVPFPLRLQFGIR
jgi:hypothetical protein